MSIKYLKFDTHAILLTMAFPAETRATPAPQEKIPPKILSAVSRVRVSEYLQLRYQSNRGRLSKEEYQQISDGAEAIKYDAVKSDNRPYDPSDKIKRSVDPWVRWARAQLVNVPFPQYLAIRKEVLEAEINRSAMQRDEYRDEYAQIGSEKELVEINNRLMNQVDDLNLTFKAAAAAQISLS